MEYENGKKLVSIAGLTALLINGGGIAAASDNLEGITSQALKQQIVRVQEYQQPVKGTQYHGNSNYIGDSECCVDKGCNCCVGG